MKIHFSCSLRGGAWWKTALSCMILFLAALIPLEFALMNLDSPHKDPHLALTITGCVVFGGIFILAIIFIAVKIFRILAPKVSLGGKSFGFLGKKRSTAVRFSGRVSTLLKFFVAALILPVTVWAFLFFSLSARMAALQSTPKTAASVLLIHAIIRDTVFFLLFIIVIPFGYIIIRWLSDIRTKNLHIHFTGKSFRACVFMAGQTFLTMVTCGIYWPIQAIKTWRYFASGTICQKITDAGEELIFFGFDGNQGKGFTLLWGQMILCVITLGLYFPWAFARSAAYFLDNTYIERN